MARSLADPSGPTEAVQPNLFDMDDATLDEPVPFVLTARGRRAVDPDVPRLRVVGPPPSTRPDDGLPDPREDDQRLVEALGETGSWRHARARALARSGSRVEDVAADLGVHPAAVRVWLAEPGVPTDVGGVDDRLDQEPSLHDATDPLAVQGVALLAACGTIEPGAVLATTTRIGVAEAVVDWLRAGHGVASGQVRVILQVADRSTSDLVARAWADRLGLTSDRVSTVEWGRAPGPRAVQATVRISGRDLARRIGAQLDAWPLVD